MKGKGQRMSDEIIISLKGGKKVQADYKNFEIKTDQSVNEGGEASAPEPYALFLASIGTCAGVYVLSFCQSRNIPTHEIKLVQKMAWSDKGKLTKVSTEIVVPPTFPTKYHKPLTRVAGLCAVKRTIQDPPEFEIQTVVDG